MFVISYVYILSAKNNSSLSSVRIFLNLTH